MKALISPNESFDLTWISGWVKDSQNQWQPVYSEILNCQRIAEVEPDNKVFEVAQPLYWVDCPDNCLADIWYFKDGICSPKPENIPNPEVPEPQTSSNGEPGVIA